MIGNNIVAVDTEYAVWCQQLEHGQVTSTRQEGSLLSQRENPKRHLQVYHHYLPISAIRITKLSHPNRMLATDRGFEERVHEDMLVYLLDAFVWRTSGAPSARGGAQCRPSAAAFT